MHFEDPQIPKRLPAAICVFTAEYGVQIVIVPPEFVLKQTNTFCKEGVPHFHAGITLLYVGGNLQSGLPSLLLSILSLIPGQTSKESTTPSQSESGAAINGAGAHKEFEISKITGSDAVMFSMSSFTNECVDGCSVSIRCGVHPMNDKRNNKIKCFIFKNLCEKILFSLI